MNRDEKKILIGIYNIIKTADDRRIKSSDLLACIRSPKEIKQLNKGENWLDDLCLCRAQVNVPLRYLTDAGFIECKIPAVDDSYILIKLNSKGVDEARKLTSWKRYLEPVKALLDLVGKVRGWFLPCF